MNFDYEESRKKTFDRLTHELKTYNPEFYKISEASPNRALLFFNYVFYETKKYSQIENKYTSMYIAFHPDTTAATLEELSNYNEPAFDIRIAQNPNINKSTRRTLIERNGSRVPNYLLYNPSITMPEVGVIILNGNAYTAEAALQALPNLHKKILDIIFRTHHSSITTMREYLSNPNIEPAHIRSFVEEHGVTILDFLVAKNPNTPLDVLRLTLQSDDIDETIRRDIALNVHSRKLLMYADWPVEWVENALEEILFEVQG